MHGQTRYPALLFQTLYEDELDQYPDGYDRQNIPDFCIELPRVMLTPCRVCVTGFQIEMSNRIIRKFVQDHNYSPAAFLRVTVADENGDKLFADELTDWRLSCPDLEKNGPAALRIYILCLKGLSLNGKMYEFLAYSSSQLKEASFWMVCPQHGWTIQRMRDSMGDFSMCKTPSKYAARIGQCFSTTLVTAGKEMSQNLSTSLNLRVNDNYPDILSNDLDTGDELCHSDGAGLIRKDVLMKILKGLPIDIKSTEDISTIQIRYGGAKGVLTAWNFQDVPNPNCLNYDICLRPSMVKFQAAYSDLEVITIGKQIGYYLNRNVILLLVHHNVEEQIFIDMQTEMFQKLNEMLTDADLALQMVTLLGGFDGSLVSTLKNMLLMGLKPTQDPFLFSCLHSLRAHHLMNLRKKARIFVEKGAVLIGAIDELGLLPEGHVFIHVQKSDSDENDGYEPIVGPVMVTKHPVMHPGDVRMLIAVDLEELRGHRNVILFSQFGARPEPDKMAGSDLDGDQFAVTWDERLFLQNGNAKPMDYSPTKKAEETNEVNDYHLVKHFINHARNDNLGRIAMLWLDHAVGKNDAGCQECIELAKLHSTAVDFPKSGIPAVIHKELIIKRSQPRAHWRELKGRESFHCESILGKLYDSVIAEVRSKNKLEMYCKAMAGRKCDKNGQILIYGDAFKIEEWKRKLFDTNNISAAELVPIEDERLQMFANDQRDMYERQVYEVMNKYKVKSEGEIITGCILKYHKLQKRRRHDVAEEIRRQIREIKLGFREEFFRAVFLCSLQGLSVLESDSYDVSAHEVKDEDLQWAEEVLTRKGGNTNSGSSGVEGLSEKSIKSYGQALATAYYAASYSPEMHWRSRDYHCVLFSFPWVVAVDVLASAIIRYY